MTTPLFLYGTLLDPAVLEAKAGERGLARGLESAVLRGWRRVTLRGTPYPTLLPAAGAVTEGALLLAGPAALARLAAYEGASYRLVPVLAGTARGPRRARAWITDAWRADPERPWSPPGG